MVSTSSYCRGVGSRKIVERPGRGCCKRCAREARAILRISLIFINDVIIPAIIDYYLHIIKRACTQLSLQLLARQATKGRCIMIFIVFGSPHLTRRGYNNNEYYYDHRKSAAAMAYLAAAAPTPLYCLAFVYRCMGEL